MTKVIRYASVLLMVFVNAVAVAAQTSEQKTVIEFVQKMYSHGAGAFEFGRFNGHYVPEKFCALMEDFFQKQVLSPMVKDQGCQPGNVFIRYPGAGSEELNENAKAGQMPKPKLGMPKVEGEKASISTTSEFGKTIFFLTKTEKGWRIENALYYERVVTEANACRGQFLKEPTLAQLKLRPECKDY